MPSRNGVVGPSVAMAVADPGDVAEVRRAVAAMCRAAGLDKTEEGRISIVVTEAATNVVKHGRGGEVVLSPLQRGEAVGIEVLALDRGPGIPDPAALGGGHSTVSARGTGFDAIRRVNPSGPSSLKRRGPSVSIAFRSAPAQNATSPAPVRTITRASSSATKRW